MAKRAQVKAQISNAAKTTAANPPNCTVTLPVVPPLYGMKTPHNFLPFSHAEERLSKSRNYWI
jgi:hypothetical protein